MKSFTHITQGEVHLGMKRDFKFKALAFSDYAKVSTIARPPKVAWERPIQWNMLGNGPDTLDGKPFAGCGDCVVADAYHQVESWSADAHAGSIPEFTCDQAVATYSAVTGYVVGDDSTDNGTDPIQMLQWWQKNGLAGYALNGFAALDISSMDAILTSIYLFGGAGLSFQLPAYMMNVPAGGSLSLRNNPGGDTTILGGHQGGSVGYGSQGLTLNWWGATFTIDFDTLAQFLMMAQARISTDWIKQSGISPSDVDLNGLLADLKEVA